MMIKSDNINLFKFSSMFCFSSDNFKIPCEVQGSEWHIIHEINSQSEINKTRRLFWDQESGLRTEMPEMQGLEPGDSRAKCQKSKDENSVNREIATLLLNLASRTQAGPGADSADHFKSEMETEAMDLSKVGDDHLPLARTQRRESCQGFAKLHNILFLQ